jgi:hypothetical protein
MWSTKVQGPAQGDLSGINHSVHKALLEQAIKAKKPVPATPPAK